ncbi:Z1 domain-containing protein [Actinomadura madurae]|uniref:Z1 domain-containing protein n=1 Tax=Actinomadura madurae TaxID=1993 RepID=A0A1I5VBN4_9ACTN|nr:Z1 domain-containing protein [Actinomadura madurae]SFQ04974.1 Z1 domain-containing protein [Actinomadura madurae]
MTDALLNIHTDVLDGMRQSPRNFQEAARLVTEEDYPDTDLGEVAFRERLVKEDVSGGPLLARWRKALAEWDRAKEPRWAPETLPRTDSRRAAVYDRLRVGSALRKALTQAAPVDRGPGPTIIAHQHTPWYTPERAAARSFYWHAYEDMLKAKGWSENAIASLDEASRAVVERLTDPEQVAIRQAKGLVVGYVQSGKTANFTGVIAKAIDAGYRLVIVLGGTLNMLRAQTQRRLDMEVIGQENILRGADPGDVNALIGIDYVGDDEDWPKFVQHGGRPSALKAFDIERLTTRDKDYKSLAQGIRALEFEKREPTNPLYDPVNLHYAAARLLVVKKNKSVLTKLVKDLKQVHGLLGELPALIIDDESDQASVNTIDPKKWKGGAAERTAINGLISDLLKLLPRAQYVGYTATPFANVFVDPSDAEDIFPSDFLISLPRPDGYMGVQEFHDLDSPLSPAERTVANSQEKAHVRDVPGEDDGDRLQEAMDSFVLAGALKLFRAENGVPDGPFRHHTMLVHESVRVDDHAELALHLNTLWHQAGYLSEEGHFRLAKLWSVDFAPVSAARAPDLPNPVSYEDVRPYVSRARQLIGSGGTPVVVVNGSTDRYFERLDLDFDRTPHVWKILVGGTKLSRGFTVEGLTVTYYRRTTRQADTLMQMGRWFGFRPGYQDLVRLYIGRAEQLTKTQTIDLYQAFEAVCRDEEMFREELARYAVLVDGKPQVTPNQIPPLVAQHLPWLKPSARNKMFNAELIEVRSPGQPIEPAAYPLSPSVLRRNTERWSPLLTTFTKEPVTLAVPQKVEGDANGSFPALTTKVSHTQFLSVLSQLEWEREGIFQPHLNYLAQLDGTLAKVDDWLLVAPQLRNERRIQASLLGSTNLSLVRRTRQAGKSSFGRIASEDHRMVAQRLIDAASVPDAFAAAYPSIGPNTGVALLYPVVEGSSEADVRAAVSHGKADPSRIVMAFTLIPPRSAIDTSHRLVRFQVKDAQHAESAIVPSNGT